jgi:FKBP-type peptidyl-prolyl cis-trans isomerase FklB
LKILGKLRVAVGFCLAFILAGCDQPGQAQTTANEPGAADPSPAAGLDSDISQASYLLGYQRAQALSMQTEGALDMQAFVQGVGDFVAGADSKVSAADQARLMQALQTAVSEKMAEASVGIRDAGDAYRAAYAQQEGVVQLPSGLLYEVLQEGSGPKPAATDTVSIHYHGTLIDGTVFDSSVERGQPASFPVNGVISGWTEALQLMAVGSKWRLVIPPELAYGDRGAGGDIKPGATLVFEVELLEIQ